MILLSLLFGSHLWMAAAESIPVGPWDYSARVPNLDVSDFRIWLPDANVPVRGMISIVPESNEDGRDQVDDPFWQDLARELGVGIIACFFKEYSPDSAAYCYAENGSGEALLEALEAFAIEHARPELKTAPLLLWGHSAGGQFNFNFACWMPQRTLAFVVNKGGFYYDKSPSPATRAVPAILFVGGRDTAERAANIKKTFEINRARGALWALCVEPGTDHGIGRSREVAAVFFRSVVASRFGASGIRNLDFSQGWIGDSRKKSILPAAEFKGYARHVSWLPDEISAREWLAASQ